MEKFYQTLGVLLNILGGNQTRVWSSRGSGQLRGLCCVGDRRLDPYTSAQRLTWNPHLNLGPSSHTPTRDPNPNLGPSFLYPNLALPHIPTQDPSLSPGAHP